jgi:ribosomal protection tetracycline resistance protein
VRLLPPAPVVTAAEPQGTVFAVERTPSGEKLAYLRLFAGELRPRQRVVIRRRRRDGGCEERSAQVTSLRVVGRNGTARLTAGDIGRLGGLAPQVGDRIGLDGADDGPRFARPTLRTAVQPRDPADAGRLHAALISLADEDPLIHAQVVQGGATEVLLYGEVQKEVIAERLAVEHGVEADFTPSRIECVERPVGVGEAVEEFGRRGPRDSGVAFRYETELGALPRAFHTAIEETVHLASRRGPHGWAVTDCRVTLIRSGFEAPVSVAADFRGLTAVVLAAALERAGTQVYEPYHAFELEIPADVLSEVASRITALGARIAETAGDATRWRLTGTVAASRLDAVQRSLPGLTRGEAVWWTRPSADQPIPGVGPT